MESPLRAAWELAAELALPLRLEVRMPQHWKNLGNTRPRDASASWLRNVKGPRWMRDVSMKLTAGLILWLRQSAADLKLDVTARGGRVRDATPTR